MTTSITVYKGKALTAAIDKVIKAHGEFEKELHIVAFSALAHSVNHHNTDPMDRLVRGLGGSVRKNALIAWAIKFGECKASEDGKGIEHCKKEGDLVTAEAKPFWEFKPEVPFTAFDLGAELAKLVKRAEKAAKDERNNLPAEGFRKVRELASAIKPAAPAETAVTDPLALTA